MGSIECPDISIIVFRPSVRINDVNIINIYYRPANFFAIFVCYNYLCMVINCDYFTWVFDTPDIVNPSIFSYLVIMLTAVSFAAHILDAIAPRNNTFIHTSTAFRSCLIMRMRRNG